MRKSFVTEQTEGPGGIATGDLSDFLAYHLHRFQVALAKYTDIAAGELNIDRSSIPLLLLVDANPGTPQGQIAQAMNLKRSSIVPIVDRLENDGYLERLLNPADSRSKALKLTRKGSHKVKRIKKLVWEAEAEIFSGFSASERKLLIELMDRATKNLYGMASKPGRK